MRLHNHLHILATAAAVAAISAPGAHAEAIGDGGRGGQLTNQHVAAASHHPAPTDWTLIALASGGTVVLVAAGLGGSRRLSSRRAFRWSGQSAAPNLGTAAAIRGAFSIFAGKTAYIKLILNRTARRPLAHAKQKRLSFHATATANDNRQTRDVLIVAVPRRGVT